MAELGMRLVEAAAAHALAELAAPAAPAVPAAPAPSAEAQLSPEPLTVENPATDLPPMATRRIAEAGLLFARLCRAVRQAIALEARIVAEQAGGQRHRRALTDPRRAILRRALHDAAANHPDTALLRREADERLDDELAADLDQQTPIPELLVAIADDLGLEFHYPSLPDDILNLVSPLPPAQTGEKCPAGIPILQPPPLHQGQGPPT